MFEYGVDSLPLFMAALRAAGATDLVERHRAWLQAEIDHFYAMVVDPSTGLVRSDRKFSAHRDTVVNRSNAYGNTMVALLAKTIEETGWFDSPFERHFEGDYGRLLVEHFWVGDHFRDALGDDTVSGEANIWPFYTGVIADPAIIAPALAYLDANGFCDPYPLRYETSRRPEREVWLTRHVLPDYQGSTVWTSLGAMYLQVLRTVDPVARRDGDRPLRRVDRARRHVLGGHERPRPELGQPALDHDRRGVDALVGDLPRRPREQTSRPFAAKPDPRHRSRGPVAELIRFVLLPQRTTTRSEGSDHPEEQ